MRTTMHKVLPYQFRMRSDHKLAIINARGQVLVVRHVEVVKILQKDDLDVNRRKMYEAAKMEFEKNDLNPNPFTTMEGEQEVQ